MNYSTQHIHSTVKKHFELEFKFIEFITIAYSQFSTNLYLKIRQQTLL